MSHGSVQRMAAIFNERNYVYNIFIIFLQQITGV